MLGRLRDALIGPGRRRQWRRRVLRRMMAAACAALALLGVVRALRAPADGPTATVLVASQPIAVGEIPLASAVRVAQWPVRLVPAGALQSASQITGRRLNTVIWPGEPITQRRLSTSALLDGQPAGTVAVHVALADPAASAMVSAGDRVDLVGPAGTVASGVLVLRTDDASDPASDGLVPGPRAARPSEGATGVVVAAGHDTAVAIARTPVDAMGRPDLSIVVRGG